MTPFRSILIFYHVARELSVAAAAKILNVTPPAISQQLRVLEDQIGVTLITRSGRKIKLTEEGERYFEMISDDVTHIIEVTDKIRGLKNKSLLVIRATPTVATKWLLPKLGHFMDMHPDIDIRVDGSNEPVDFYKDPVDLEIRHGRGHWPDLHSEPLVKERFLPICSPELIAPNSIDAEALLNFRLIYSVKAQIQWQDWFSQLGLDDRKVESRLFFDRSHMSIDAATLGMGVALESNLMMFNELQDGRVCVPMLDPPRMSAVTQWLVCPPNHLRRKKVHNFLEWIKQEAYDWSLKTKV